MTCYPEKRGKRLTGKWIAEAFLPGVGRVRKRCENHSEGERWANYATLAGVLPKDPNAPQKPAGTTWGEVVAACLAAGGPKGKWKSGRDPSVHQRLDLVTRLIGPDTPIGDVTTPTLDRVVAALARLPGRGKEAAGLSPGAINRYLGFASAVLTFAVSRKRIAAAPEVPWQQEVGARLLWLSEEDEKAICQALLAKGHDKTELAVRVLVASGLRWGEFESLEPGQIEDDKEAPGRAWIRLWRTKTNRPRSVPIPQPLARELRAMVASKTMLHHNTTLDQFRKAVKDAGRDEGLVLHSLRHTTASRLVQKGVNLKIVQQFLGHTDIKTTLKYAHINDEALAEAAERLSPHAGQSTPNEPSEVIAFPTKSST